MNRRLLGWTLGLAATLVYVGFVVPTRRSVSDTGGEYREARQRRYEAVERLRRMERLRASRERATATLASSGGDSLVDLRRSVIACLEGFALSNVRLRVASGRSPVSARVSLSAEGAFSEIVRLTGALVGSGTGLVLDKVGIRPAPQGVALELEASRLGELR
jgi:hypothetical protein